MSIIKIKVGNKASRKACTTNQTMNAWMISGTSRCIARDMESISSKMPDNSDELRKSPAELNSNARTFLTRLGVLDVVRQGTPEFLNRGPSPFTFLPFGVKPDNENPWHPEFEGQFLEVLAYSHALNRAGSFGAFVSSTSRKGGNLSLTLLTPHFRLGFSSFRYLSGLR